MRSRQVCDVGGPAAVTSVCQGGLTNAPGQRSNGRAKTPYPGSHSAASLRTGCNRCDAARIPCHKPPLAPGSRSQYLRQSQGAVCLYVDKGQKSARDWCSLSAQIRSASVFTAPVTHQGLGRQVLPGWPFPLKADQKIFGSKPCPRGSNNLMVVPACIGSRPGQQKCRSPYGGGEWGPNQSPGFTSFVSGSPSRSSQLSKGSSGYPNIFS